MKEILLCIFVLISCQIRAQVISNHMRDGRSIHFIAGDGDQYKLTPYGNYIVRVQVARSNEDFFKDDHYEMVESHKWPGNLSLTKTGTVFRLSTVAKDGISIQFDETLNRLSFYQAGRSSPFLDQKGGTRWDADTVITEFIFDHEEHFSGLGHGFYGREQSIDLHAKIVSRNYGTEHGQQAPLIVPFYLSSKGYGIFLNSTFPNRFNFGSDGKYEFSIYGPGRMDYFVILGPEFSAILDRYTQLTGRTFLPPRSFFGLALSDKGNDHNSADPSDESWWKKKIMQHRAAGFPLDHMVNDNRWRAGGGERCISYFDWDKTRYPDPAEYARWIEANGLITTLDLNRCIAVRSAGWKTSFNIPDPEGIDFNTSAPDLTKKEVRDWFWDLMWSKSLNPKLGYPGDALWIDEFDEMGKASPLMKFANGGTWMEMRNYWFFLIAKSLVQQGWNKSFAGTKRPFVWVRGMTAGAQRYATLWSGDIRPSYDDMQTQVRAMQLSGLSGFPFWGHDAGGFHDWEKKLGPDDAMYRQWSMAFGSFTPFWKPHGMGASRWPLDRPEEAQKDSKVYSELRYKLIPYIYSYAHVSYETGMPVARAMIIDHQDNELAWKHDLQYMWGKEILVAPNCSDTKNSVFTWLPEGQWYDFWNDEKINGDKVFFYPSPLGKLPLFIKAGAIIPMSPYALSTAFISNDSLTLHVYAGADGKFTLYEDDGISEAYKTRKELRKIIISFDQASMTLKISVTTGNYINAPATKVYNIIFHGFAKEPCFTSATRILNSVWDKDKLVKILFLERAAVNKPIVINGTFKCGLENR